MPRRNVFLLFVTIVVCTVCWAQADSAHRTRYGRMFDTMTDMLEKIESKFVRPIEERKLFEGALRGVVAELDDPYSAYYNPHAADLSRSQLKQEFGGVGIEVLFDAETRQLTVVTPLPGGPAQAAGIMPGDTITAIDGRSARRMTLDDATSALRGKPGTTVRLAVMREGQEKPLEFTLRRAIINTETVVGYRRKADGSWDWCVPGTDIGYVRLVLFGERTADELRAVLEQLTREHVKGVVLDLRDNGGGLLSSAVDICNLFIRSGVIVSTRGRDGQPTNVQEANDTGAFADLPLAVLINGRSASGSEIVAACLQDHDRAAIVGSRSFGKGTVQDVLPLEDGKSELRLTVATYWRASGKNIHRFRNARDSDDWGVMPDAGSDIPLSDEEWVKILRDRRTSDASVDDAQLARAVQILSP
jgi:carboxyl-terminal processing protease